MMKKLISIAMFLTALTILSSSARAQGNPENVVTNLYKADKAKTVAVMSKTELRKYFSKTLADDLWKALNTEYGLGFSILYHTDDDSDIKNFRIGKAVIKKDGTDLYATVQVTFINFGEKRRIEYILGKDFGGNWKILDMIYHYKGERFTLKEILNEGDN
jgi:ABC-type transporter MlaC component